MPNKELNRAARQREKIRTLQQENARLREAIQLFTECRYVTQCEGCTKRLQALAADGGEMA